MQTRNHLGMCNWQARVHTLEVDKAVIQGELLAGAEKQKMMQETASLAAECKALRAAQSVRSELVQCRVYIKHTSVNSSVAPYLGTRY